MRSAAAALACTLALAGCSGAPGRPDGGADGGSPDRGADAPFARIKTSASGTTCGICHRQESQSASVPGGFVSAAFRPAPGELVKVTALAAEHDRCVDAGTAGERCDLFHALFDFGEVRQGAFSTSVELLVP